MKLLDSREAVSRLVAEVVKTFGARRKPKLLTSSATINRVLKPALTFVLLLLACGSVCHAQFETIPNIASQTPTAGRTKAVHRTIITYNGAVCLSTPSYELMPNGQVIFKRQGMRFDGSGYFWSPSIRDNVVRRNRFGTRVVGTSNQYWPPLSPTTQSIKPNIRPNQISRKPKCEPVFWLWLANRNTTSKPTFGSTADRYVQKRKTSEMPKWKLRHHLPVIVEQLSQLFMVAETLSHYTNVLVP